MKLIIAIVPDNETETVSNSLTTANYRVTQIASTGGFLRRGHSTLLIGVDDEELETALQVIRSSRTDTGPNAKRGVIFVLKVDQYIHF
jgi:uncharacterized protein YaaQ